MPHESKIGFSLLKLSGFFISLCLLLMTFRISDMIFFYPREHSEWLLNTLWMGFRFDLLILSFITIACLFLPRGKLILFSILWGFVTALQFLNSLGFGLRGEHLWLHNIEKGTALWGPDFWGYKLAALFVSILVSYFGVIIFKKFLAEFNQTKWQLKTLLVVLLLIFARGSLGKDHLRRNHCDGRPNKTIRSFCMNPAYTFLKPRNQEFP
jgi:hypothetical protein